MKPSRVPCMKERFAHAEQSAQMAREFGNKINFNEKYINSINKLTQALKDFLVHNSPTQSQYNELDSVGKKAYLALRFRGYSQEDTLKIINPYFILVFKAKSKIKRGSK